jgi:tetratricopeptide (TPR) repeat protein
MERVIGIRACLSALMVTLCATAPALYAQDRAAPQRSEADTQYEIATRSLLGNNLPDAESAFRRLREVEPEKLRWLPGTVDVMIRQQKKDDAVRLLQSEVEKAPQSRDAQLALADAAAVAGLYELADRIYGKVLESVGQDSPQAAEVYLRQGQTFGRRDQWESSLAMIRKAKALQPDSGPVLLAFAMSVEHTGNATEIQQAYRDVLRVQPGNWVAMNNLAFTLAKSGDVDNALVFARRAKLAAPEVPEVIDTLGYVYTAKRLINLAIPALAEAVRKAPGNMAFREHLADALAQRNDPSLKSVEAAIRDNATPPDKVLGLVQTLK